MTALMASMMVMILRQPEERAADCVARRAGLRLVQREDVLAGSLRSRTRLAPESLDYAISV